MKRLELAFDDDGVKVIDELKQLTGLRTNREFFNNVITLFDWAVLQMMLGRSVVSLDDRKSDPKLLLMPSLQHAQRLNPDTRKKAISRRSEPTEIAA